MEAASHTLAHGTASTYELRVGFCHLPLNTTHQKLLKHASLDTLSSAGLMQAQTLLWKTCLGVQSSVKAPHRLAAI